MDERRLHYFRTESLPVFNLHLRSFVSSESAGRYPEDNQDAYYQEPYSGIAIVADGIHDPVGQASNMAVRSIRTSLFGLTTNDVEEAGTAMRVALEKAHRKIKNDPPSGKASVTAVKVIDTDDGRTAVIGSVGKTRAYLLRDNTLELITRDHGVRVAGEHTLDDGEKVTLESVVIDAMDNISTQDELRAFMRQKFGTIRGKYLWQNRRHVNFALGASIPTTVPIYEVPLQANDKIILVTDGMQNLSRAAITEALITPGDDPASHLVQKTYGITTNSGEIRSIPTDVTAIVVDVNERERRIREHNVKGGEEVQLAYNGQPYTLMLPDGNTVRIGKAADMGCDSDIDNYVLVNDQEFGASQGASGVMWLDDKSYQFVGRSGSEAPWQVHKGGEASHVKICRKGDMVTFRNLYSSEGFIVRQPLRD